LNGEIKAFGGPGGEDHITGGGSYQVGYVAGGGFDGSFGPITYFMIEAAGVAKICRHRL
jgi:hypothetical protein